MICIVSATLTIISYRKYDIGRQFHIGRFPCGFPVAFKNLLQHYVKGTMMPKHVHEYLSDIDSAIVSDVLA